MEKLQYMYWFHGGKPSRLRRYTLHIFDGSTIFKNDPIDKYGGNFDVNALAKSMREVKYNVPHHCLGKLMHVSVSNERYLSFCLYNWMKLKYLNYIRKSKSRK